MSEPVRRGVVYGSGQKPLEPYQVRTRRFQVRPWCRSSLDPVEVYAFLNRVAEQMADQLRELRMAQAENERIKGVLRHWQTWHRHCAIPDQRWPSHHEIRET